MVPPGGQLFPRPSRKSGKSAFIAWKGLCRSFARADLAVIHAEVILKTALVAAFHVAGLAFQLVGQFEYPPGGLLVRGEPRDGAVSCGFVTQLLDVALLSHVSILGRPAVKQRNGTRIVSESPGGH
jgi:hypothetical protein